MSDVKSEIDYSLIDLDFPVVRIQDRVRAQSQVSARQSRQDLFDDYDFDRR